MTGREPYVPGPGPDYRGLPAAKPKPADGAAVTAALSLARRLMAKRGQRCTRPGCRHSSHVHRHRNPGASHCGVCDCGCTAYQGASQ